MEVAELARCVAWHSSAGAAESRHNGQTHLPLCGDASAPGGRGTSGKAGATRLSRVFIARLSSKHIGMDERAKRQRQATQPAGGGSGDHLRQLCERSDVCCLSAVCGGPRRCSAAKGVDGEAAVSVSACSFAADAHGSILPPDRGCFRRDRLPDLDSIYADIRVKKHILSLQN